MPADAAKSGCTYPHCTLSDADERGDGGEEVTRDGGEEGSAGSRGAGGAHRSEPAAGTARLRRSAGESGRPAASPLVVRGTLPRSESRASSCDGANQPAARAPRRTGRGSALYLRLWSFDPDRLFARLLAPCRIFFTPAFLVGSAALIVTAAAITAGHWAEIVPETRRLFNLHSLAMAYV